MLLIRFCLDGIGFVWGNLPAPPALSRQFHQQVFVYAALKGRRLTRPFRVHRDKIFTWAAQLKVSSAVDHCNYPRLRRALVAVLKHRAYPRAPCMAAGMVMQNYDHNLCDVDKISSMMTVTSLSETGKVRSACNCQ